MHKVDLTPSIALHRAAVREGACLQGEEDDAVRAEKLRHASLEYLTAPDLARLQPSPLGTHEGLARLRTRAGPSGSQTDAGSSQASGVGLQVADRGSVSGGRSRGGSSDGTSAAASSQGAAMTTSAAGPKRQWDRRRSEEGVSATQLQCSSTP